MFSGFVLTTLTVHVRSNLKLKFRQNLVLKHIDNIVVALCVPYNVKKTFLDISHTALRKKKKKM